MARLPAEGPSPAPDEEEEEENTAERFTFASFNVLSRSNAQESHPLTPLHLLKWPHRRQRLLRQIVELKASVLCLQSIDDYMWWHRELSGHGYDLCYQRRKRSEDKVPKKMSATEAYYREEELDGVAVAWKRREWQLIASEGVLLQGAASYAPSASLAARLSLRDDVAMLCLLAPFNDGTSPTALCVASFQCSGDALIPPSVAANKVEDEDLEDELEEPWRAEDGVRLEQARYLVRRLSEFNRDAQAPVLAAGSLNAAPSSAAYSLLAFGSSGGQVLARAPPRPPRRPPRCKPDVVATSGCRDVKDEKTRSAGYAVSRSSVELCWEPGTVDVRSHELPIETYWIQWRVGGSRVLNWTKDALAVSEIDATRYVETRRADGKIRTMRDPEYHKLITGLVSGVTYEFRIAAESPLGRGDWSPPSKPFATTPLAKYSDDFSDEPPAVHEDRRQKRLFGSDSRDVDMLPRLILTPKETERRHRGDLEDLSLAACLEACREHGIPACADSHSNVILRLFDAAKRGAVDELVLLEKAASSLRAAGVDMDLVSADPETRRKARQKTKTSTKEENHHPSRLPFATRTGLSPRHSGAVTGYAEGCVSPQTKKIPIVFPLLCNTPSHQQKPQRHDFRPDPHILDDDDDFLFYNDNAFPENPLGLRSAFRSLYGAEPPYTTTTETGAACLDYVFCSGDTLTIVAARPIPRSAHVDSQFLDDNAVEDSPPTAKDDDDASSSESSSSDDDDDGGRHHQKNEPEEEEGNPRRRVAYLPNETMGSDHLPLRFVVGIRPDALPGRWNEIV